MEVSDQLHASAALPPVKQPAIESCLEPRTCLDVMEKGRISYLRRESDPNPSVIQPVAW
jgi:hypothetical protein